ncbi:MULTISPECIES: response regulator transcription factor [Micromonospora]|uniref:Transcriptional regulator n=1 Tax=Micromonospora maris TaxID=1003110 RepID=A0A9X0I1G0_9ACTN|nr:MULTISPECIES: response regulator transcription factor [Micromonospora]AEB45647.1 two component transcriptional regulator, LuxR family protein [Micromonospora maris AB-18-032]KUJ44999.1 transcriptional regulator [Micromonospora maris]RUL94953.1 DNA-binding response regulator [Verrucosispora sp. FIM060022]
MIRTLLALDGALVRGALSLVLTAEADISVVAEVDRGDGLARLIRARRPDVAVIDLDLVGTANVAGWCPLLVLVDQRRARRLHRVLVPGRPLGILGRDVAPHRVLDGLRRLARGESVIDVDLVMAALTRGSPLTSRETQILDLTAAGAPVAEVARALGLAPGTVRNHLGRITRKVGARTRVEAVRVAHEAGWI